MMKKCVIYARYSSDRQNEQSIAGQVEVCTEWAKKNNIEIISIYHDEALTGKTDRRPDFQRMIKDAKLEKFDYIIVYKLDRFARNRYDSAIYKAQLKKYNVKVLSAMESISDGPEGIILESVLEGMAEYYSANLSQNVLRGMHQRAELGKHLGGTPPLGYKLDNDKNYIIDEDTAPIVKTIFEMYATGNTLKDIADHLNNIGYKTSQGKRFVINSFGRILKNEKYIGQYKSMGIKIDNVIPQIIDNDLFYTVQKKLERNKRAPAHGKSNIEFYLTGKLFCGKCGNNMAGDSGTSSTGITHYYYSCSGKKKDGSCTKKSVKKEWIEQIITDITINEVLTDENIEDISKNAIELYEKEKSDKSELISLYNTLNETQKTIDNIIKAIEQGIITETTKKHLLEAEEQKKSLLAAIAHEEIKKPKITQEQIKYFLCDMKKKIYDSDDCIEIITRTFVNAVYLYDDKLIITFNLRDGEDLKKIEIAELEKFGFDSSSCTTSERTLIRSDFSFAKKNQSHTVVSKRHVRFNCSLINASAAFRCRCHFITIVRLQCIVV